MPSLPVLSELIVRAAAVSVVVNAEPVVLLVAASLLRVLLLGSKRLVVSWVARLLLGFGEMTALHSLLSCHVHNSQIESPSVLSRIHCSGHKLHQWLGT